MKIFDMDGPVYRIGTELADVMILSLYWVICCIPIITIGAATSSLFYVYGKKVRNEDVYVTRDYFKSFRQNFKQSIPITIILLILWISAFMYINIIIAYSGYAPTLLTAVALFFVIEVIAISIYVLAILSRFYMKVHSTFMTAFVLAHKHLLTTVTLIVSFVGINIISLFIPILMFVLPALTVAILSYFVQKIFNKHIEAAGEIAVQSDEKESIDEVAATVVVEDTTTTEKEEDKEEEDKEFLKYI